MISICYDGTEHHSAGFSDDRASLGLHGPLVMPKNLPYGVRVGTLPPGKEIEATLAEAIRSSAGGQMTRSAEVFLAGVCAKHPSDHLALAGFVLMRRVAE